MLLAQLFVRDVEKDWLYDILGFFMLVCVLKLGFVLQNYKKSWKVGDGG